MSTIDEAGKKGWRTFYICMNVRGFLNNTRFPRGFRNMLNDNGRTLTPDEARDYLYDQLAQGRKVIPMSSECGNPCKNPGCKGFDYAEGGCPGYEIETPAEESEARGGKAA